MKEVLASLRQVLRNILKISDGKLSEPDLFICAAHTLAALLQEHSTVKKGGDVK
jgi:hypothetical protein